ncbi:YicC/YloC family endoribonuclease [Thioclava sp. A2]|uniref:YicC/YloC family endoribonuclease n=1 Tax=Thioclava sp. FCG-A2 TaxID=3080562 RepID=UPI002953F095|nr:YicC/YloC family endoribonuclease [Thioclava sp. A2]MDV7269754.1 YicC/YloC family endoribonuclease [Thioclava sp. A2]
MVKAAPPIRTVSMTGFASGQGAGEGHQWSWDIRSVNGKNLDLRLRLPELAGLEQAVRKAVGEVASRGNITLNVRLSRDAAENCFRVNAVGLQTALAALAQVQNSALASGLEIAKTSAAEVLAMRGVVDQTLPEAENPEGLVKHILGDLVAGLTDFSAMRRAEGGEIGATLAAQIDRIESLTASAAETAEARRPEVADALKAALARVMEAAPGADAARVAQELALLAVKADVTEELDRLRAHIKAARALLSDEGAVGRKFEFLAQEFVREANTLCSKSGNAALTAIGLDLKHVIDQMREQIMNVE